MIHLDRDQLTGLNEQVARLYAFHAEVVRPAALDFVLVTCRSAAGEGPPDRAAARAAASLLHGLIIAQPFRDGNKRTAWHAARVFLAVNGWRVGHRPEEAAAIVRAVGGRTLDQHGVAEWLLARMQMEGEPGQPR